MTAYQFTPFGIVDRLGLVDISGDPNALNAAGSAVQNAPPVSKPVEIKLKPQFQTSPVSTNPGQPLRPRDVLKAARLRVKEIKAELRRLTGLQKELSQLERLLAATKSQTPLLRKVK